MSLIGSPQSEASQVIVDVYLRDELVRTCQFPSNEVLFIGSSPTDQLQITEEEMDPRQWCIKRDELGLYALQVLSRRKPRVDGQPVKEAYLPDGVRIQWKQLTLRFWHSEQHRPAAEPVPAPSIAALPAAPPPAEEPPSDPAASPALPAAPSAAAERAADSERLPSVSLKEHLDQRAPELAHFYAQIDTRRVGDGGDVEPAVLEISWSWAGRPQGYCTLGPGDEPITLRDLVERRGQRAFKEGEELLFFWEEGGARVVVHRAWQGLLESEAGLLELPELLSERGRTEGLGSLSLLIQRGEQLVLHLDQLSLYLRTRPPGSGLALPPPPRDSLFTVVLALTLLLFLGLWILLSHSAPEAPPSSETFPERLVIWNVDPAAEEETNPESDPELRLPGPEEPPLLDRSKTQELVQQGRLCLESQVELAEEAQLVLTLGSDRQIESLVIQGVTEEQIGRCFMELRGKRWLGTEGDTVRIPLTKP